MPVVVQKYGGSSVADTERIQAVARRIARTREAGKQVCVVVSAMGGATDELLGRARQISQAPPRRELDMLLSCGERASMALLSMAVSELGYEAISFTGSQSGIMTNDRHSGARIVEVRPFRVQDELERGRVVIVAGFQGVSYKREITTLGRGGSDTTAVALAAALGAEHCEICSDVEGVYSADPRLVSAAELLEAISHDEMLELAAHGARVLHAEAVEFARRQGVALWARATATEGPGTRIDPQGAGEAGGVAVAGQKKLVGLRGGAGALAEVAGQSSLPIWSLSAGDPAYLVFGLDDVPDWDRIRRALPSEIEVEEALGAVSVVGALCGRDPAALARARKAAAEGGIEVRGACATPLRLTLFCGESDVDPLVRQLHRVFREER